MDGRRFFALAIGVLSIVGSACSTQAPAAGTAQATQSAVTATVAPSASAPTQAPPSSPAADDCDIRAIAASAAQNTMVLSWETIDYQVKTDKDWKEQVDAGYLDVAKYRAAVELVKDLPDAVKPNHPKDLWSKNSGNALKLASLLEQAAASGTPFADGIGKQIVGLANELRGSGMWAIYDAVDSMCYDPADEVAASGVDELIAILAPPNAKETNRLHEPQLFDVRLRVLGLDRHADELLRQRDSKDRLGDLLHGRLGERRQVLGHHRGRRPSSRDHHPQAIQVGFRDHGRDRLLRLG